MADETVWNEISKELILPAMGDENGFVSTSVTDDPILLQRTFSLIQAYLNNDDEAAKNFLPPNECELSESADGESSLARAVAKNSFPLVELLLQRGVRPLFLIYSLLIG